MPPLLRLLAAAGVVTLLVASGIRRVEEHRDAVQELAADRGAASVGGVLLAWLADLDADHLPRDPTTWSFGAVAPEHRPLQGLPWAEAVQERRRERARRAAATVPLDQDRPTLVTWEGDTFLVMPARGVVTARVAHPAAYELATREGAPAPDPAELRRSREELAAEAARLRDELARAEAQARAAELQASLQEAAEETRAAVEELRAEAERLRDRGDRPGAAAVDAARALAEAAAQAVEGAAAEAPVPTQDHSAIQTAPVPFDVPPIVIPSPDGTGTLFEVDLPALLLPTTSIPVPPPSAPLPPGDWTRTVAWWPSIEADIIQRTGILLQAGGEPPGGRLVLPAFRLEGEPVWSLPSRPTAAAVGAFDATRLLLLLGGIGWLAVEVGLSRRRSTQERATAQARDEVLQRLSHELRTPAAAVRSLVDAIDRDPGQSADGRRQFLALVRGEAERLAVGIDRLLQAARGEARLRIDPVPMDLAEWADGVAARWRARLPGLERVGGGPIPVVADPERLDEAVDALLDNAIKHGGPAVKLGVAAGRLWVEDDGIGLDPRDRERVLKKFGRVEGRVNDAGGHGLGLWAAGEVARAHGGRIGIEGRNRFVLTLGRAP